MERNSVSTRVKLALKRRELLSFVATNPRRGSTDEHEFPSFGYGRPMALVKSAIFVSEQDDESVLRERFALSRAILRDRLAQQFVFEDGDCGCEEQE